MLVLKASPGHVVVYFWMTVQTHTHTVFSLHNHYNAAVVYAVEQKHLKVFSLESAFLFDLNIRTIFCYSRLDPCMCAALCSLSPRDMTQRYEHVSLNGLIFAFCVFHNYKSSSALLSVNKRLRVSLRFISCSSAVEGPQTGPDVPLWFVDFWSL